MKLDEVKDKNFSLMQLGMSGHGKTTRTLTATRFGKLLILDFDGKIQGASRKLPDTLSASMPTNWRDLVEVESLRDKPIEDATKIVKDLVALKDKIPYATVAIDTYTLLNEKVYQKFVNAKLAKGLKAERDDWGQIGGYMSYFFDLLYQIDANLILNCHLMDEEDERSGQVKYGPQGKGGHRASLSGAFSDTHYMFLKDGKYQIRLKNSETFSVNTTLPPQFIDKNGLATINDLSIFDGFAKIRK